jgi:hypothetical protein
MKVVKNKIVPKAKPFEPFSITIQFDKVEEAQELYMLCNYSPLVRAVEALDLRDIRDAINVSYGNKWSEFSRRMP